MVKRDRVNVSTPFNMEFVKVRCVCAQSCPTLCSSMDCTHQALLSMGFPRQKHWSGLPLPSQGDFPNPGFQPTSPALQVDSLPLSHQRSPAILLHAHKTYKNCHVQSNDSPAQTNPDIKLCGFATIRVCFFSSNFTVISCILLEDYSHPKFVSQLNTFVGFLAFASGI